MKVLIVSDTHGDINNFERAIEAERPFDFLIHLGDNESDVEDVMFLLENVRGKNVFGNCDFYGSVEEEVFELEGKKIFITHGHRYQVKYGLDRIIKEGIKRKCDIVLYGHTHITDFEKVDNMYVYNPGSLSSYRNYSKSTYGVMTLNKGEEPVIETKFIKKI